MSEYIEINGCCVDKKIYDDAVKLNRSCLCPFCKSIGCKIIIDCRDVISIFCLHCKHFITQMIKQYPKIRYEKPPFPCNRKLRDYDIGDVIYLDKERGIIKRFKPVGDKTFYVIYELDDCKEIEQMIIIDYSGFLKQWEYEYFINNPDYHEYWSSILLNDVLHSFCKDMGGEVIKYKMTKR